MHMLKCKIFLFRTLFNQVAILIDTGTGSEAVADSNLFNVNSTLTAVYHRLAVRSQSVTINFSQLLAKIKMIRQL